MSEKQNISERLRILRAKRDWTQQQAADAFGYDRNYISMVEGGREPGPKFLRILAMLESSPIGETLTNEQGLRMAEETPSIYKGGKNQIRQIPIIGWAQAADAMNLVDFGEVSEWESVPSDIRDPKAIAVRIRGDSMEPDYKQPDIAILACSSEPHSGNLIIGRLKKEGAIFKKLQILDMERGIYRLISFNPHYVPVECNRADFYWLYPVHSVIKKLM